MKQKKPINVSTDDYPVLVVQRKWIKFKEKMPPEPMNVFTADQPVMIGIWTVDNGVLVDFIYWERQGDNSYKLNYEVSHIWEGFGYNLSDLSWYPYPLPELEEEL